MVDLLASFGADLTLGKWAPVVVAAHRGHNNVIRQFIKRKVGLDRKTDNGDAPIHAVRFCII